MLLLGCHNMQLGMGADFVPTNTLLVTAEASWIFLTVVNDSLTAKYWLHFTEEENLCHIPTPPQVLCVVFSLFKTWKFFYASPHCCTTAQVLTL